MMRRRAAAWVVLVTVAIGVAAAPRRAAGTPPDLAGRPVGALEFACSAPIDREGLRALLPFTLGSAWQPEWAEQARALILQTALFSSVRVEAALREADVVVTVHLERTPVVNAVDIRGNRTFRTARLQRAARMREGTVLRDGQAADAATRLQRYYVERGFEAVQVTPVVQPALPGDVDVTFQIDEGPATIVDRVDITGDFPVPGEELLDESELESGDRFERRLLRRSQEAIIHRLRDERYYEADVATEWTPTGPQHGTLRFDVNPGPPFTVEFVGVRQFSKRKLLGLLDLAKRAVVTDGTWRELGRRIRLAYQDKGFYLATVDVRVQPGSPKVVRIEVREGESLRVGGVEFNGNVQLDSAILRRELATGPPSWAPWRKGVLRDDVLDGDLRRLWFLYRRYGFEAAEIADVHTDTQRVPGKIYVTVDIVEGPQTVVQEVVVPALAEEDVTFPALQTTVGTPLDPARVEADRRALLAALGQQGYAAASVTPSVTSRAADTRREATVTFAVTPGSRYRIDRVIVQNNVDTRAKVVTRELPFGPGDRLDPGKLAEGQNRVQRLGLFRNVTVHPAESAAEGEDESAADATRDVLVNVSERPPGTLQWGAGYNTRDGFRGFSEVAHNNLQGLGRRLSLRGELSYNPERQNSQQYVANLGYREPWIRDTRWTMGANVIGQRATRLVTIENYAFERLAFLPVLDRPLWDVSARAGVQAEYEAANLFDVKDDLVAFNSRDEGHLRTVSVGSFFVWDRRDDPFLPSRGYYHSLRVKLAPRQFGSQVPYVRIVGQHSHYIPLGRDLRLIYALRGGWGFAYENQQVPIRERFFLGGRTTVRGYNENAIGPRGDQNSPLGGDWAINANLELHFPLLFGVGGATFLDGGGTYLLDTDGGSHVHNAAVTWENFRRSVGLGLRYDTPVGPLALDYGFKLDRRSHESIGKFHFSIGTIF